MKKKIKKLIIIGGILAMMLGVTACSGPSEKEIKEEMQTAIRDTGMIGNNEIDSIEIKDSTKHENEDTIDYVICIKSNNGVISYEQYATASYVKNENNEWLLDDLEEDESLEVRVPIAGVPEEGEDGIWMSLDGYCIPIGEENWSVRNNNVLKCTLLEQKTDLEGKKDKVKVALTVEDEVTQIEGELTIDYVFTDHWEIQAITGNETFELSVKQGKELEVTDEDLISEITQKSFVNREHGGIYVTSQAEEEARTVYVNRDEFSNFTIIEEKVSEKGKRHTFVCEGTLIKSGIATFKVQAEIPYCYSTDHWNIQPFDLSYECTALDIKGEWVGIYRYIPSEGEAKLNITDMDSEGNITGIYSFGTNDSRYSSSGSYHVSGKIDFDSMEINLTAGEWIEESSNDKWYNEKQDIKGLLYVEERVIQGTAQGGLHFSVTR